MKISKQRFFALLILISLTFSLNGCSSSDDEASKDSPQTFLEKYDGTLWREVDDLNEVYYYFQNNLNNPVIKYYNFMGTCYIATIYDTSYFSIEENSISTLKIKEVYSGG